MKRRSCQICNLKALLLLCVAVGHGLERDIAYNDMAAVLYRVVYLFHMPLFAFVSGMGVKSGHSCFLHARRAGKQYLGAQGVVLLACLAVQPGSFFLYLTRPFWHLWYLLSLASWNALAGCLHWVAMRAGVAARRHIKQGVLLFAVTVGLLSGYFSGIGRDFSLSRTLVFFPFFLAGAFWGSHILDYVSRNYWLLPLALLAAAGSYFYMEKLPVSFLYQAEGYPAFGLAGLSGVVARLACYLAAVSCSVLVLLICSKERCVLTRLGGDTLLPYLLHPVFIWCLEIIPYAPPCAVPVSFALGLMAVFSIHLSFRWRRQLFLYTGSGKKAA